MRAAALAALAMLAALTGARVAPASDLVWWEGEHAFETNFPQRSAFSADTFPETRQLLSAGDWLTNSGPRVGEEAFARWRIEVPAAGEYELWARKFWLHGPFRWRFGEGDWRICGQEVGLADSTHLRTHLGVNWVYLGDVELPAGPTVFEIRLLAEEGEELTAAFDCFALSRGMFVPNGRWRPGERSGLAEPGWFAWEPAPDHFGEEALLDLRWLNEDEAGESGFVRRQGDRLVLGSGEPVRFWAVNAGPGVAAQHRGSVDYLARALAKRGVNMVRFHGPVFARGDDPAQLDPRALDNLHYLVAAMKRQGIYTTLSFHFPLWFDIRPEYGIPGFEGFPNTKPFALLFFEPRMQEIHRGWLRGLLTTPNPYSGRPLAQEPALALIEIVNEDSFFFWTFSRGNIPEVHWGQLETMFGRWLTTRYGSIEQALVVWEGERLPEDDPAAGRAGVYEIWHLTSDGIRAGGPGKAKRVGDQVRFLTELQRGFYEDTVRHIREDLGAGSLVSCSNWTVADARLLDALERYTYTAGDVIDQHGYFGGRHEGEGASYSVRVGHTFQDRAAVRSPEALPLRAVQVAGYPHIISELGWTNPNRYRADACLLGAAYGALQGLDGLYWFAVGSNYLADSSMEKFALTSPVIIGSFPAAALIYRRGDVRQAEPAVRHPVALKDLYAMRGSEVWSEAALDELRRADAPEEAMGPAEVTLDPLAFYAGPVLRDFEGEGPPAVSPLLASCLQRDAQTVTALTGELHWDYGRGVMTMHTPRSQGAAGFLSAAGPLELGEVAIECDNEFASIIATSLDGEPLARSRRLLVQAMTEERPYGFRAEEGRILALGDRPFNIRKIAARVRLRLEGEGPVKAVALDENGYPTDKPVRLSGPSADGSVEIELAPDAVYHVLLR